MNRLSVLSVLFSALFGTFTHALDGHKTDLGQITFQAVFLRRGEPSIPICGGVIISDRHVLTTASCAQNLSSTADVYVGDSKDIASIRRIKIHEAYVEGQNNIAVVEVYDKFDFTRNVTSKIDLDAALFDDETEVTALGISGAVSFHSMLQFKK